MSASIPSPSTRLERAGAWWSARAPREQWMLALMLAALAAFAFWYGLLLPLQRAADRAYARHASAAADLGEIRAAATGLEAARAHSPQSPSGEAVPAAVAGAAEAAGVPITRQRHDAGTLTIGIDAVDAPALLAWLDALQRQHGLAPLRLDIGKRNGRLHAEAAFTTAAPP